MPEPAADPTPLPAADAPSVQVQVLATQARQVFERTRVSNLLSLPLALLLLLLLLHAVSPLLLGLWLLAKLLVCAWRWALDRAQRHGPPALALRHLRGLQLAHVADGLVYGAIGTWLVPAPGSALGTLLVATSVCAAAAGFVVLSHHFRTLLCFELPLLLPVLAFQFWMGTPLGLYAGVAGLLFLALVLVDGRRASQDALTALQDRVQLGLLAEQRQAALALAQQQGAVKTRFLATMSHEMRTPLHGMLGITRLLQSGLGVQEPSLQARQLRTLEQSGEHLLTLISDVIDFARIESGQLQLHPVAFDLQALVAEVGELTQLSARDKGLSVRLDSGLGGACWVMGDAPRLRQVLVALTGNAIKFTEVGGITLRLARGTDAMVTISVSDTGSGIRNDQLARVFDAFHQADDSNMRRHGGTGLGLAIARQLVRLMGGDLACANIPGAGARFTLQLPMPEVSAPPAPAAPVLQRLSGHVLLVEDNPVNAMVAEAMLARAGLQVDTVTDGAQAVQRVRDQRYDVVLMDCQMPVLDGISATRCIRQEEGERGIAPLTIVGLTANATDDDRRACLAAGMDDYLPKPFRDSHLQGVLARYLKAA